MKYRITIPEPCHENWQDMTAAERGKFCDSCNKNVFDFTKHSTHQLFNELETNGQVCGRFRPDQLDRDLESAPAKRGFSFRWMLSSALVFGGLYRGSAQEVNSFPLGKVAVHQSDSVKPPPPPPTNPSIDSVLIKGIVTDEQTGETIPFAEVYVAGTSLGTFTDFKGEFELKVPRDTVLLEVRSMGYDTQTIRIEPTKDDISITVKITSNAALMGDVVIVKPTIWQRMGHWFRRVF